MKDTLKTVMLSYIRNSDSYRHSLTLMHTHLCTHALIIRTLIHSYAAWAMEDTIIFFLITGENTRATL